MDTVTLASVGLTVTEKMTNPTKPGKAPRPVWEVTGATDGWEDLLYELGAKRWRGAFSFWEDPTEALLQGIQTTERTSFAERMEGKTERAAARAERYETRAEKAEARSNAAHEKFRSILDPIPLGQPILVGHHSERRHRRALERADAALGQSVKESDKAKYYAGRAAASEFAAAPKSVAFMQRRLKEAEAALRQVQRTLERISDPAYTWPGATEERKWEEVARFTGLVAEYTDRVAYWREQIAAAGAGEVNADGLSEADQAKKAKIKKGDYIESDRDWYQVLRVNAKTVTGQHLAPWGAHYRPTIPYAEIQQIVTAEEYAARQAQKEQTA